MAGEVFFIGVRFPMKKTVSHRRAAKRAQDAAGRQAKRRILFPIFCAFLFVLVAPHAPAAAQTQPSIDSDTATVAPAAASEAINPSVSPDQTAEQGTSSQDNPGRTSRLLSNSYVGLQAGYLGYAFSRAQVQPGFQAQSVQIPHLGARVFVFGHEFNKYLSVQFSEMRPVEWVRYHSVNGDQGSYSVWMNVAGLTAKGRLPLTKKWAVFGEGGLGIATRKGFAIGNAWVVNNVNYATVLFGGGVEYRINDHWTLLSGVTAAPGDAAEQQPRTVFFSGGANYTLRHVPSKPAGAVSEEGPIWPKNVIEVGYITNAAGYGVNNLVANRVFFPGTVQVASGFSVNYQRNVFHLRRFFALDWGADVSTWESRKNHERFYTVALYPALRVPVVRRNPIELYFAYSLAGPALMTRTVIDGQQTGRVFTFQDFMSVGAYLGRKRRVTAELRIAHYSNGNLFPQNPGVTIPLGFYVGTSF